MAKQIGWYSFVSEEDVESARGVPQSFRVGPIAVIYKAPGTNTVNDFGSIGFKIEGVSRWDLLKLALRPDPYRFNSSKKNWWKITWRKRLLDHLTHYGPGFARVDSHLNYGL